jgi:hypothetical protein
MKDKCCGNCRFFGNEDLGGHGECQLSSAIRYCGDSCISHRLLFESWTEITPDNEEEVYGTPPERLVIASIINGLVFYSSYNDMSMSIATMAKYGGYYYYVLPELKKKETK